jgi:hypothetical protein
MKVFTEQASLLAEPGIEHGLGPVKIRVAVFEDYNQIACLQIQNGLAARSYEDWQAAWTGNPVFKQVDGQWPIGWVLETTGGEIVGFIGNIPLAYHFRGRELVGAASSSWVVDPRYRSYSMLLKSYLMRQEGIDLIICTTVSSASESSYDRGFRFSRVPVGTWDKSAFWITNYRGFSQSALNLKSVRSSRLMSYPVSAALSCWDGLRGVRLRDPGASCEIRLCSEFDSRFDAFWEESKLQGTTELLAVRTRDTLAWHYRYSLLQRNVWILTASHGSRLVAYAIFDRRDNLALGLKRIRFVDFQALKGWAKELGSLLWWVLRKCREEGIHVLENDGCWLNRPGLPLIPAPYQRSLNAWMYYYKAIDKNLSDALTHPDAWAPSSFDGDASL